MLSSFDISTSALVAQRTRLNAISSNIANMSTTRNERGEAEPYTPRYVTFQTDTNLTSSGGGSGVKIGSVDRNFAAFDHVKDSYKSILRHDGVNVSMENQVNQMVKNQQEHNMAVGILSNQFRLLRAAISERAS